MGFTVLQEGLAFEGKRCAEGPNWLAGKELGAELGRTAVWVSGAWGLAEVTEGAAVSGTGVWAGAAARAAWAATMPN